MESILEQPRFFLRSNIDNEYIKKIDTCDITFSRIPSLISNYVHSAYAPTLCHKKWTNSAKILLGEQM